MTDVFGRLNGKKSIEMCSPLPGGRRSCPESSTSTRTVGAIIDMLMRVIGEDIDLLQHPGRNSGR